MTENRPEYLKSQDATLADIRDEWKRVDQPVLEEIHGDVDARIAAIVAEIKEHRASVARLQKEAAVLGYTLP
jgi:hypothetical protein